MSLAVACMSGSFKGVFVHGVLTGLEREGVRARAYAAASSTVLPAAYAAAGRIEDVGIDLWIESAEVLVDPEMGMSDVAQQNIAMLGPKLEQILFVPGAARFLIATSQVLTKEAAELTQGKGAVRLGRKLLIDAAHNNAVWRDANLKLRMFDTAAPDPESKLDAANLEEVAYATTRMLHAWDVPATIGGKPYIDGSYTCLCPAIELAEAGFTDVLAIATEAGPVRRDMFRPDPIPEAWQEARIRFIRPSQDLKGLGVDYTIASPEGLRQGFDHGIAEGRKVARLLKQRP